MKKQFTLLTKTLLVAVCLLGGTSSAWATDVVSFASGTWTGGTATYTTNGSLDSGKLKLASTDNTGTEGTKHVQVVLSSGTFQTGDAISITYYASNTSKTVTPGFFFGSISDETFTSAASIQAEATSAGSSSPATQTTLAVPAAANGSNVLRLTRYSGGTTLYITALSITRATAAPTITSDLASSAEVYVGVAQSFSITAAGATSYQWYKASSTTADIANDAAIEGATSSSYSYTATAAGTEYLYCAVINAIGTTLSKVCAVTATAGTFHSVTYSLGAATGGTVPTQADVAEGATFDVAAVPGDLVPPSGKEFKCWNDGTTDYNPGATYTMGTSNVTLTAVYQDRTYDGLTPTGTLDLTDGTNFVSVWHTTEGKLTKNFYYDAINGIAIMSSYAVYQSKNAGKIDWETYDSGNSGTQTWSATGSFKGSSYYFDDEARATAVQQTTRNHYYRVTGITSVSALFGGKAGIAVYEVSGGVVTADPIDSNEISEAGTATVTGLSASKEYIVKVYGKNGSSNIYFQEIAFTFPAVANVSVSTLSGRNYGSYVTTQKLDFGSAAGITAYIATGFNSGKDAIVLEPVDIVPAGEPIIVMTDTKGATVNVPVTTADADDVSDNALVAGDGTTAWNGTDGYTYYYIASDKFHKATSGTLQSGKAYLKVANGEVPTAPVLNFVFDLGETTSIADVRSNKAEVSGEVYNLNGQRVAQPTKGLYIVNGRKVVIK